MICRRTLCRSFLIAGMVLSVCEWALANECISGSDGSDGPLNCDALGCPDPCDEANPCTVEIDLSQALTGAWDTPIPKESQGVGIYDPLQWAVVFKYTTIDIPAGVTVTFKNHPSHAPVFWLATGDVTIAGMVSVAGEDGSGIGEPMSFAKAGPGGFAGGVRGNSSQIPLGSAGFGPGGGPFSDPDGCWGPDYSQAGYGTPGAGQSDAQTYGTNSILPLIGGSGGSGGTCSPAYGGGAGGGAIAIASSESIMLAAGSEINADGGGGSLAGGGSGGAIRLISNTVSGDGALRARGGPTGGGDGRIRVDALSIELDPDASDPLWTTDFACWPVFPPSYAPTLRATFVAGQNIPEDPQAGIQTTEVQIENLEPVELLIEATNIPPGTEVDVRVVPARGQDFHLKKPWPTLQGTFESSTATAMVPFVSGKYEIQLRANWTP